MNPEITKERAIEEIGTALSSLSLNYGQHMHLKACLEKLSEKEEKIPNNPKKDV